MKARLAGSVGNWDRAQERDCYSSKDEQAGYSYCQGYSTYMAKGKKRLHGMLLARDFSRTRPFQNSKVLLLMLCYLENT